MEPTLELQKLSTLVVNWDIEQEPFSAYLLDRQFQSMNTYEKNK